MSALDKLVNPAFWINDILGAWHYDFNPYLPEAAKELAQLRAENAEMREAATNLIDRLNHVYENREYLVAWTTYLDAKNTQLRARLDTACHIKANDKVGFDWKVLDTIEQLRAELENETKWACDYSEQVEKLTHENAEMREALEKIDMIKAGKYRDMYNHIRAISSAVLAKYPKE